LHSNYLKMYGLQPCEILHGAVLHRACAICHTAGTTLKRIVLAKLGGRICCIKYLGICLDTTNSLVVAPEVSLFLTLNPDPE
jgi:hypothetical protein